MKHFILATLLLIATPALANPRYEYVPSSLLSASSTDFTEGKAGAPVVIIEYASLSCPHCAHFHLDVLPALKTKYIDTGKVLYILRPYPLNEPALKAAELVDCVGGKEGAVRYYAFVNVLFETQAKWAFDPTWQSSLATISRVGGVSPDMYEQCTGDKQREIKILTMKQAATKELGVDHTPYIFINSHRYDDDATKPEKIGAYIDKLLGGKADAKPVKPTKKAAEKPVEKPETAMTDKPLPSLESLKGKIDAAQAHDKPPAPMPTAGSADTPDALRIGAELATGIAVGAGIGILLDRWLGTSPWGLIICFCLGCAAGFLNLKRAAERMGGD